MKLRPLGDRLVVNHLKGKLVPRVEFSFQTVQRKSPRKERLLPLVRVSF